MTPTSGAARVTTVAVAVVFAATLLAVASPGALAFGLIVQILFIVPGLFIVRRIAGTDAGWLAPLTVGPIVGHALATIALTLLWSAGGRGLWVVVAAPAMVALLIPAAGRLQGRWRLPALLAGDRVALLLLLLLVPLVVAVPFAHVGQAVPDGQAYRAYFTADYVWRRAVVVELAKGDFLPINPYFLDDPLHYYWMPHLLSGAEYRAMGHIFNIDHLLLLESVFVDVFFVAFLYGLVRMFVRLPWAAAAGVATVTLCSSYEGAYALWAYHREGIPLGAVRYLNIDAVSRWMFDPPAMPIDGLQRLLLYQPHHQVGYAMGLLGLIAVARRTRRFDPAALAVAGALLGLSTLLSSFAGMMFTAAVAVFEGTSVLKNLDWRRAAAHAVAGAVPLAAAAGAVLLFQYVDPAGNVLIVRLNPMATQHFLSGTFLSIGPVLILGIAGALIAARGRRGDLLFLGALTITCVVFYFFIDVKDHQDVYAGWRVGHLLFMGSTVVFALLFEHMAALEAGRRRIGDRAGRGRLAGRGADDRHRSLQHPGHHQPRRRPKFQVDDGDDPGGLAALCVVDAKHHAQMRSCRSIPSPAPRPPGRICRRSPSGAWRWGCRLAWCPSRNTSGARIAFRRCTTPMPRAAYDTAIRNHIDYIIVGPPERQWHPGAEERFDSIPALMPMVLRNATISVYKVVPEI